MTTLDIIKQRNERKFSETIVQREIKHLEREYSHLEAKAKERELSRWESKRFAKISGYLSTVSKGKFNPIHALRTSSLTLSLTCS